MLLQLFSFLILVLASLVYVCVTISTDGLTFSPLFGDFLNLGAVISVHQERGSSSCFLRCASYIDCFQVDLTPSNSGAFLQCRLRNSNTTLQQVKHNGTQYYHLDGWHRMDIHLVANSYAGGRVGAMEEFPIFAQPNGYLRMVAYIADLPSSDLVLITTYDEASYAVDQSATSAAFATLGATDAFLGWRHCFCLIGCKSCGQSFPVVQVIKKASDSPCECYFSGYISFGAMTGGISNRVQAGSQARVNPS